MTNKIGGPTMNTYLVIFQLDKDRDPYSLPYDQFYKTMKSLYPHTRSISYTTYAVKTSDSPTQLRDNLVLHIGTRDRLAVISVCKPFNGYSPDDLGDWLDQHLPENPPETD